MLWVHAILIEDKDVIIVRSAQRHGGRFVACSQNELELNCEPRMKRIAWITIALGAIGGGLAYFHLAHVPTYASGTLLEDVEVSELTPTEATIALRDRWLALSNEEASAKLDGIPGKTLTTKIGELGIEPDFGATLAQVEPDTLLEKWSRKLFGRKSNVTLPWVWRLDPTKTAVVSEKVSEVLGPRTPAKALWVDGKVELFHEVPDAEVDFDSWISRLNAGEGSLSEPVIPLRTGEFVVPPAELSKIQEVIAEFSTTFPAGERSRNTNIRIAAEKIDGVVLMPGEEFSFNDSVGRRTTENGFKLAGVYRSGRHDVGIGGGICQVSGTLYNAAVLSNLEVVQRANHSMPVAYLSVGRDATVDYGKIDLRFRNSYDFPIAISSTFQPGKLTFRVLGQKDPALEVKIVTSGHQSWDRGVKYVPDPAIPVGSERVIEKGSRGHSVTTYRDVYRNGARVSRSVLNNSRYSGGVKIVAKNPADLGAPANATETGVEPVSDAAVSGGVQSN